MSENITKHGRSKKKPIIIAVAVAAAAAAAVFIIFVLPLLQNNNSFGIVQINGKYIFSNNKVYDTDAAQTEKYQKEYIGTNKNAMLMVTSVDFPYTAFDSPCSLFYLCEKGQKKLTDAVAAYCCSGNGNAVYFAEIKSDNCISLNVYNVSDDTVTFLGEANAHRSQDIDIKTDHTGRLACITVSGNYLYYKDNERIIDSSDIRYRPLALSYNDNYFLTYSESQIFKCDISEGIPKHIMSYDSSAELACEAAESTEFILKIDNNNYYYSLSDCKDRPKKIGKGYVFPAVYGSSDSLKSGVLFDIDNSEYYTVENLINNEQYYDIEPISSDYPDDIFSSDSGRIFTLTEGNLYVHSTPALRYRYEKGLNKLKRFFWDSKVGGAVTKKNENTKLNEKLIDGDNVVLSDQYNCLYYISYNFQLWKCDFSGKNTQIAADVKDMKLSSTGVLYYTIGPSDSDICAVYSCCGGRSKNIAEVGKYELFEKNGRVGYIDKTNALDETSDYGDRLGTKYFLEDKPSSFIQVYTTE